MPTQAYRNWVSAGRPWRNAKPIVELVAWARANNITVLGTLGKEGKYDGEPGDHLRVPRPEDHTPFSFTAWPVGLPGYVVTAVDLANVRGLGAAIEAGAKSGRYPWLKYMNHAGRHLDVRTGWKAEESGDQHVHLSIRSDWCDRSIGVFNPFGPVEEPDMEQTEHLIGDTGHDGRRVGDTFVDVQCLRNWLTDPVDAPLRNAPGPGSRGQAILEAALRPPAQVDAVAVADRLASNVQFVDALAAAVAAKTQGGTITLSGTVTPATVQALRDQIRARGGNAQDVLGS